MLKFEFVQHSEFSKPEYYITYKDHYAGFLFYDYGAWCFESANGFGMPADMLFEIVKKINELNASIKSQRILGVF